MSPLDPACKPLHSKTMIDFGQVWVLIEHGNCDFGQIMSSLWFYRLFYASCKTI